MHRVAARLLPLLLGLSFVIGGCTNDTDESATDLPDSAAETAEVPLMPDEVGAPPEGLHDLPDGIMPFDDIVIGGQPTEAHLKAARDAGFQTVVNLRPDDEFDDFDEQAVVEDLGMRYVHISVADENDITAENAAALAAIFDDPDARPALLHCSSGNRVGALFAARAHLLNDDDPDVALELGKQLGLTDLEAPLRTTWTEDR